MKNSLPFSAIVVGLIWLPLQVFARGGSATYLGADGNPKVKSAAALVMDLDRGTILYARDQDTVRPIASISKLMGAMIVLKDCSLDPAGLHTMSVSNREAARGGDKTRLTTGWSYSHLDLLRAALMRSDNRALPALAEACKLDISGIAEKMNTYARALGLANTSFREPNGLSPENVSTPREVMVFLKEALKYPVLADIMNTVETTITAHKDGKRRLIKIRNTDRLLTKNIAEILGGKTGYTDLAKYCLAVAAKVETGQKLGMVFLGAEGRHTRFADFVRVIKWLLPDNGFAAKESPQMPYPKHLHPSAQELPGDVRLVVPFAPPGEPGVTAGGTPAANGSSPPANAPLPAGTGAGSARPEPDPGTGGLRDSAGNPVQKDQSRTKAQETIETYSW